MDMAQYPPNQSSWGRAKQDTGSAQKTARFMWVGEGVLAVAGGAWLTALANPNPLIWEIVGRAVIGGIGGLITAVLIILGWNLFRAPYRQCNEARVKVIELEDQLEIHHLFEVEQRKGPTSLPISRLEDGTYETVGAIGPAPIKLIHIGELTKISRIAAVPEVRFIKSDNSGWQTNPWITVEPIEIQIGSVASMDFTWDTTNQRRWELIGLPLDVNRREEISLPHIQVRVSDANEVMAHFAKGGKCVLAVPLSIRTDKGSQEIDQEIELSVDHLTDRLEQKKNES